MIIRMAKSCVKSNIKLQSLYINDLLEKLKNVVKFCEEFNICLSVCGELASVSDVAKTLYSIGIKNLSVSPSAIQNLNRAYTDFKKTKEK